MRKTLLSVISILIPAAVLNAQTFTGGGGVITNDAVPTNFPMTVSGLPASMNGNFGVEEICINISHTRVDDLNIQLIAPDWTKVELSSGNGGTGADYSNTCFSNSAGTSVTAGTAPFSGSFKPEGFLGRFHEGQNPNGTWKLSVQDVYGGPNTGSVISWSIRFGTNVAQPVNFSSSNLPIIKIVTGSQSIPNEPKVMVDMGIINNGSSVRNNLNDTPNDYNGKVMIEVRGSSSQQFAKKSYSFKTVNTLGNELNISLLGMPAENEWVLHAPYSDKTLMRNYLTYNIANAMGRWAARTKYVELVIDGEYQGVYVLMEAITRSSDRVDIAKLTPTDNAGDSLTGGYIIKIDRRNGSNIDGWYSNIASTSPSDTIFYQYHYPESDRITQQQKTYIQDYVRDFEQALLSSNYKDPVNGYRKYIDMESFVDYFILTEFSKNIDGYRLSTYLYKDKDSKGGKLTLGPVWDYDLAYGNADYGMASDPSGWQFTTYDTQFPMPKWWSQMVQDTAFMNRVKCRWLQLRLFTIDPNNIGEVIDETTSLLNESQARNFTVWPTLGTVVWPNPSPVPTTYQGEVDALKNFIASRISWLDNNLQGTCPQVTIGVEETIAGASSSDLQVYPNPFTGSGSALLKYTLSEASDIKISLYDMMGREVRSVISEHKNAGSYEATVDANDIGAGMYFYRLTAGTTVKTCKVIIQE
jgi:subtilisin-like proprotein convertase family protein